MTNKNGITRMLTAREVQDLLHVDRSTIYRMADSGRLPAIKVGKQWRFPADQFHSWFQRQVEKTNEPINLPSPPVLPASSHELENLLSWDWLQTFQTTFADLLGVMIVVTDIQGRPINQPSNPCGLFKAVSHQPAAMEKFVESWHKLAIAVDLTPSFRQGHLGLLCARSMIAVGTELKGMVIAGCIAPDEWPPTAERINEIAKQFALTSNQLPPHIQEVYYLNDTQKNKVLTTLPRIASLIARIINERKQLVDRLEAIANLVMFT